MAIDIQSEQTVPLSEAPAHIPGRPHVASVYRWTTQGVRGGIRLESIVVGGVRYTSIEAIQRFIERTTAASAGASVPPPKPTTRQREAAIRRAERALERAGV